MITHRQITAAQSTELATIKNTLTVDKMKLDRFFSVFLDEAEMDTEDTNTHEWITYREMLKEYERVNDLIKTTDYYLGHYETRPSSFQNIK